MPHILGPEVFGEVVAHDGGWRWTFSPAALDVHSETFSSEEAAANDLSCIQRRLHPAWPQKEKREEHLRKLVHRQKQELRVRSLASEPVLKFTRGRLKRIGASLIQEPLSSPDLARGLPNLGNTCLRA